MTNIHLVAISNMGPKLTSIFCEPELEDEGDWGLAEYIPSWCQFMLVSLSAVLLWMVYTAYYKPRYTGPCACLPPVQPREKSRRCYLVRNLLDCTLALSYLKIRRVKRDD